jgi:quinolinate synthase
LNQEKHILTPAKEAHCPLANFLSPKIIQDYREQYPELPVVTYVNSTAAVKAESDICCTSSNSVDIAKRIQREFGGNGVLFGPDNNLAEYVEEHSDIKIIKIPEKGHCYVHSHLTVDMIEDCKKDYPESEVLVHPECTKEVRHYADYVGSTAGMYNYVKDSSKNQGEFIIGTEKGLLDRLSADFPEKQFHLPSEKLICKDMKKNKLETIKHILQNIEDGKDVGEFEVRVPQDIAERALTPIDKMLQYS